MYHPCILHNKEAYVLLMSEKDVSMMMGKDNNSAATDTASDELSKLMGDGKPCLNTCVSCILA